MGQGEFLDKLICRCFCVAESTIREAIRRGGLSTIDEVMLATRATAGCSSCYEEVEEILCDVRGVPRPRPEAAPASMNRERRERILEVLRDPMEPLLRANRVQIHLVDVDGARALVRVLPPPDRTTHDESLLAIKRFFVESLAQACGTRISLLELNVLDEWGNGGA